MSAPVILVVMHAVARTSRDFSLARVTKVTAEVLVVKVSTSICQRNCSHFSLFSKSPMTSTTSHIYSHTFAIYNRFVIFDLRHYKCIRYTYDIKHTMTN